MSAYDPSPRELQVLEYIRAYIEANGGDSPTFMEIAGYLGVKKGTAQNHINRCILKKLLTKVARKPRSLEIAPRAWSFLSGVEDE